MYLFKNLTLYFVPSQTYFGNASAKHVVKSNPLPLFLNFIADLMYMYLCIHCSSITYLCVCCKKESVCSRTIRVHIKIVHISVYSILPIPTLLLEYANKLVALVPLKIRSPSPVLVVHSHLLWHHSLPMAMTSLFLSGYF